MSSKKVFNVNDKVFAKIRGYPAWPAIVSSVKTDTPTRLRYSVYFYGTGERAECKPEDLCPYEENKSRLGKPNKRKYFAEALLQIEDSSGTLVLPEEEPEVFTTPSNTSSVEQVDYAIDDTEVEKANESNSESEKKLTVDESNVLKGKKVPKRSLGISRGTKRKISDVKPEASSKKSLPTKAKCLETSDDKESNSPIVLVENIHDKIFEKVHDIQNNETADNVITDEKVPETIDNKLTETLNTTEAPVVESSSELSLDTSKTTKSVSKVKDSPNSSCEVSSSSNVGHVSRSGRKIKPKKYSDYENDIEVPKRSRTSKENSKSSEKQNTTEIDNSSEQNIKPKDTVSNTETKKTSKTVITLMEHINDSETKEIQQISNKLKEETGLSNSLKSAMITKLTKLDTKWSKVLPSKEENIDILHTEIDLLDSVHKLRLALRTDNANYETALDMLEQISELQIEPLMLKKHKEIVDTIRKVSKYVGNPEEWKLSEEEAIKHTEKATQIRRKADVVLNKFALLFTIPDGQLFEEHFKKELEEFFLKTEDLTCDQICGLTSENFN